MAQFQFNDENNIRRNANTSKKGFANRLIGWGIVQNESQANIVLIALAVIALGITFYNMSSLGTPPEPTIDPSINIAI